VLVTAGPGPFTLFAPTDRAFSKVPKSLIDDLLKNKTKLESKYFMMFYFIVLFCKFH